MPSPKMTDEQLAEHYGRRTPGGQALKVIGVNLLPGPNLTITSGATIQAKDPTCVNGSEKRA